MVVKQERANLERQRRLLGEKEKLIDELDQVEQRVVEINERLKEIDTEMANPDAEAAPAKSGPGRKKGVTGGKGKGVSNTNGRRKKHAATAPATATPAQPVVADEDDDEAAVIMPHLSAIIPVESAGERGVEINEILTKLYKYVSMNGLGTRLAGLLTEMQEQKLVVRIAETRGYVLTREGVEACKSKKVAAPA